MIITRKIEVVIHEKDPKKKKKFTSEIFDLRNLVRRAANIVVSHKFVQRNLADFDYLTPEIMDKAMIQGVTKKGPGYSQQNITYRVLSKLFKGTVHSSVLTALNQMVSKSFNETYKLVRMGDSSIRSYKNDIPIPFNFDCMKYFRKVKEIPEGSNKEKTWFEFELFNIPFKTIMGKDHSNNISLLEKVESEYSLHQAEKKNKKSNKAIPNPNTENQQAAKDLKICSCSLKIESNDNHTKMFLLMCVDIPQKVEKLKEGKTLFACLSVNTPIICSSKPEALELMKNQGLSEHRQNLLDLAREMKSLDDGVGDKAKDLVDQLFEGIDKQSCHPYSIKSIGTKEEFLHRRIQIQKSLRRCQINNRYTTGGKGRERKCQAIERWHKKEHDYIDNKLHTYAKELVKEARKQGCSTILLCNQQWNEMVAKANHKKGQYFMLRNWSYYSLKEKIGYKAAMYGIEVKEEETLKSIVIYFDHDDSKLAKKFGKQVNSKKNYKIVTDESKVKDIDSFDIVYVGVSGMDNDITYIVESFINNNIGDHQLIVPYTTSQQGNISKASKCIQSRHPNLKCCDGIAIHLLSDEQMRAEGKRISNSQETGISL